MMVKLLPTLLATILVVLAAGIIACRGLIKQEANLLAFALVFGGLLGWTIGSAVSNPQLYSGLGVVIGFLCVLPAKNFKLSGRRPAIVIGIGWTLIAIGWVGWIMRDSLIK